MTAMTAALRAPVPAPAFRRPAAKPAEAPPRAPRGPATRAPSAAPRRPAYASVFAGFRGAFGVV